MRDRLVANVSDFLKIAFLRALAGNDRTLGVAWYYVPGEVGRPDGDDLAWRKEAGWEQLDPVLYAALTGLPERSVTALERAGIWPEGTSFHRMPIPPKRDRDTWGEQLRSDLSGADIVYLDPDIGLGKASQQHATLDELDHLRRPGRTVGFVTFPGKSATYDEQVQRLHKQINSLASSRSVLTLRTSISVPVAEGSPHYVPRARWFTLVDADDTLIERIRAFAEALPSESRRVSVKLDGAT